jgi:hypothetical protein
MKRRISFLSALALGVLMFGHFEGSSVARAAVTGQLIAGAKAQAGAMARGEIVYPVRSKRRSYHRGHRPRRFHGRSYGYPRHHRRPRSYFYFGPSFLWPDDGYGYSSYDRCTYWSYRCAQNWGYGNSNYYGCLRYHGCW